MNEKMNKQSNPSEKNKRGAIPPSIHHAIAPHLFFTPTHLECIKQYFRTNFK